METEERTFPLTKLTSEVVAVAKAAELDPKDKRPATAASPRKRQLTLSKILKEIVRALGNSAESSQYYLLLAVQRRIWTILNQILNQIPN